MYSNLFTELELCAGPGPDAPLRKEGILPSPLWGSPTRGVPRDPRRNRGAPARGVDVKPHSPAPPVPGSGTLGTRDPSPRGAGEPRGPGSGIPGPRSQDPGSPGPSGPGRRALSGSPGSFQAPWRGVDVKPLRQAGSRRPKRAEKPEKRLFRGIPAKKAIFGTFC